MWTDLGWFIYQLEVQIWFDPQLLACEQALRGALVVGWEKEGELATMSQEFEFHLQFPWGSPSTELSDFRQSAQSGNERECKQTRAKGNGVITNVISAKQHFALAFWCGYSNSRDVVASSSSFSRPVAKASWRACLQATQLHDLQPSCSWVSPLCVLVL